MYRKVLTAVTAVFLVGFSAMSAQACSTEQYHHLRHKEQVASVLERGTEVKWRLIIENIKSGDRLIFNRNNFVEILYSDGNIARVQVTEGRPFLWNQKGSRCADMKPYEGPHEQAFVDAHEILKSETAREIAQKVFGKFGFLEVGDMVVATKPKN